jgi:hypothetical protein
MKTKTVALMLLLACLPASAQNFYLNNPTTNEITPYGDGPWMTISLEDVGINQIGIFVQSTLSKSSEFYHSVTFDFTNMDARKFTDTSYNQWGTFSAPEAKFGRDHITFDFETSNRSNGSKRFNNNDSFYVVLSYTGSGTVDSTNLTNPIAHAQGIDGEYSTKLGPSVPCIPEPSVAIMGMIGLAALLRRKK